nr:hypothetical protein GCM10025699_68740 [Microbacterium flavescens]
MWSGNRAPEGARFIDTAFSRSGIVCRAEPGCQLTTRSLNPVVPREAAQEAVEWTEADRFRPVLGSGCISTMIHIVHRVSGPERSRVSLGEPPAFFEHDDLRRLQEASQRDGSRSTTV